MANFEFPDDEPRVLAGREKIPVYMFVDPDEPNIIYFQHNDKVEILDNSEYTLNIPSFEFEDGTVSSKESMKITTALSPMYVTIQDVKSLAGGLPLDDADIAYHIRQASLIAEYWSCRESDMLPEKLATIFGGPEQIKDDYYPFYMFIKYQAVVDCVREFYIAAVARPSEYHDVLSDLERKEKMDLDAIRKLLDNLTTEAEDWLELVATITADPKWALRGKYSYAVTNKTYRPYHRTLIDRNGWDRGY